MNRIPKAPAGFVPVDSEEARKTSNNAMVNYAYISRGVWMYGNSPIRIVRGLAPSGGNYHVQLPPPVEWEEVWEWTVNSYGDCVITKHGLPYQAMQRSWKESQLDTIVRALNEMENKNG